MSSGLLSAMTSRDQVSAERPEKISTWLRSTLEAQSTSDLLIVLDPTPDLSSADGLTSRNAKGRFVYDTMRATALQSQAPLIEWLAAKGYRVISRFWIVNAVLVRGNLALATEATAFPSVKRIVGNPVVRGLEHVQDEGACSVTNIGEAVSEPSSRRGDEGGGSPRDQLDVVSTSAPESHDPSSYERGLTVAGAGEAAECGLNTIHATDVWTQKGVRGEGIVLASMDTGVDWTHPALQSKYRGWNGGSPDHSYSWHDSIQHTVVPFDDGFHGTHTTGTMVGDDGGTNQIGVAPNAKWIACRNMDHGDGQPSTYLECMQWGLAPYPQESDPLVDGRPDLAADITNNSWGCPPSEGCDALTLQQGFETIRTAGQMTVGSAGNSGPACSTISDPLGLYDAVFTAGAVNCTSVLSGFSSRGPVTIDGSGRLKPNVAAPGSSVRSSVPGGGYSSASGTSMARSTWGSSARRS